MEAIENKEKEHVMHALTSLAKKLKVSELKATKLKNTKVFAARIGEFFDISENQVYFFTSIFSLQMDDTHLLNVSDICRFLQLSFLDVLVYKSDFDVLFEKKLVKTFRYKRSETDSPLKHLTFAIPEKVLNALSMNETIKCQDIDDEIDIFKFVKIVSVLIQNRKDEIIKTITLWREVDAIEKEHKHLPLVQKLSIMNLLIAERTLFYEMCNDLLNSGSSGVNSTINDMYDDLKARFKEIRNIKEQKGPLFDLDLISLNGATFMSDATIELTDKGLELFLEKDADLFKTKPSDKNLIQTDKITSKNLFYDDNLMQQVQFVQNSLNNESFLSMQKRMESMGLSKGVAAIFYGAPGTGKTETVYQLAKATGRDIMYVDISQTKSMWFGESEKKIKEVFANYAKLCKKSQLKPILLFNEADAVFGKRKDSNLSNVAQTENTMQNIILEEMEKLEGILIATTNLNQNLDAAFERRFLFKVKFEKPSTESKQKIWQSKLPWLQESLASTLAADFSFSGGEIDNIVRKITMEEVLTGIKPEGEQIIQFCRNENFSSKESKRSLGFH